MTKVITAYEAPALLDLHPTLTRAVLYERLTGEPGPKGKVGLATLLSDGALRFAQDEYRWEKPVSRLFGGQSNDGTIGLEARAFVTADQQGELAVVFLHLNDYMHRATWGKAGVPPLAFIVQANWVMKLGNFKRLAFLVLSDKRLVVYEVDRDEAIIAQITNAVEAMATAIKTATPPPVDAAPGQLDKPVEPTSADAPVASLEDLVQRFRAAREAKADTSYKATFAEQQAEAATEALKAALPKGASHDVDGIRIHHNAKTGRLTEEKIDGQYF